MTTYRQRIFRAFLLAFLLPELLFWLVVDGQIRRLRHTAQENSRLQALEAIRAGVQVDVREFARRLEEQLRFFEESAASLSGEAGRALERARPGHFPPLPRPDSAGLVASPEPEDGTVAFLTRRASADPAARSFYRRSRVLAHALTDQVARHPQIRSVYVVGAAGAFRGAPWFSPHDPRALAHTGPYEGRPLAGRWPQRRPEGSSEDRLTWSDPYVESLEENQWIVTLSGPIRDSRGELLGSVHYDIPVRRIVSFPEAHGLFVAQRGLVTAAGVPVASSPDGSGLFSALRDRTGAASPARLPELDRLRSEILDGRAARGRYRIDGRELEIFAARVSGTDWVAIDAVAPSALAIAPAARLYESSLNWQKTRALAAVFFLVLAGTAFLALNRLSGRLADPLARLSRAADAVREGRPEAVPEILPEAPSRDEVGRVAQSLRSMSQEVRRRVDTLSWLRELNRQTGATVDLQEGARRMASLIAQALSAEACWLFLYNSDDLVLEACSPAAGGGAVGPVRLRLSSSSDAAPAVAFRTGVTYFSNEVGPSEFAFLAEAGSNVPRNAIAVPLRDEESAIGVLLAVNRKEEIRLQDRDAAVAYADAASIHLRRGLLYRKLEETVAELRRATYHKEHFLQNINHELRTPLTSILGWSELLESEAENPRTRQLAVRQLRHASNDLLMLINDLLDLSRLQQGAFRLERQPLRAGDVLTRAVDALSSTARARGIELSILDDPAADENLQADPLRLQQVLWNLINNSLKFTRSPGAVRVGTRRSAGGVVFFVEDTGIGIPPQELPHVFDRFRQVDSSVTREQPGMGIGLSIARSIVEAHSGRIWAESQPGKGSRFSFEIPSARGSGIPD
jgi:signal transduction histidine kinase/HAMP domain-containing protein